MNLMLYVVCKATLLFSQIWQAYFILILCRKSSFSLIHRWALTDRILRPAQKEPRTPPNPMHPRQVADSKRFNLPVVSSPYSSLSFDWKCTRRRWTAVRFLSFHTSSRWMLERGQDPLTKWQNATPHTLISHVEVRRCRRPLGWQRVLLPRAGRLWASRGYFLNTLCAAMRTRVSPLL